MARGSRGPDGRLTSAPPTGPEARFAAEERRQLLLSPGIGPRVVASLEAAGVSSLAELRRLGLQRVFGMLANMGYPAHRWQNRERALQRVLLLGHPMLGGD